MEKIIAEKLIACDYEYDERVSFALQQNHVPFIKRWAIENLSEEKHHDIKIELFSNPSFFEPKTMHLEALNPKESIELHPDIQLSADYLSNLDESVKGYFSIRVKIGEVEAYQKDLPIDILSFDCWPGSSVIPEIISSFVTPNRPYVMEIVKLASSIMQKNSDTNAMDGYQSGDPNRVIAQLSAIYSAILAQGITYANPPASFEAEGQKIRFPDVIKEHKLGTCLDLTLLYAACAEAIGIHPIIVFFRGHAYPAFWLKEYSSPESYQDDKSLLTKNMAGGINDIIAVESTMLTNEKASFISAVHFAEDSLNKFDYFHFFVDVHRSRIGQIKPLSLKISMGSNIQVAVQPEEPVRINSNFAFEKVEIIPENDHSSNHRGEHENKITYWQNKLIDMTLRNNLLNYRIHTQGIPVVTSGLDQIEDILSMGKKVFIETLPNEWRNKVRDFRDQKELLTSNILSNDLKNNRLRSVLSELKLEKELVKLYRKAKNTLEETGANSLFIALGFLKWYDPKSSTTERYAPILLLPVDLVRLSAKKGYYIRARDEEIQVNISLIEYLKQNFGIDASRLYNIPKDDHGADVRKVLTTMRRIIMQMKHWDVYENASISVFSFSKFVMWNDLVNHSDELKENKVVKSLIEGSYTGDMDQSFTDSLTTEEDEEAEIYAPLSSDSTQTEAILATGKDNSFVLHGPPGSGKSQTITNMISHALASGKSVLFVAEKMAALNVVQNRLASIGLADFCMEIYSNKGQKKDILNQLEKSFEAQRKVKGTNWNEKFDEVKTLKRELNKYVQELHQHTSLGQSIFEMIETYSDINAPKEMIEFDRDQVMEMDEVKLRRTKQMLEDLEVIGGTCGSVIENPWLGIKQTNYSLSLQDSIKKELSSILTNTEKLLQLDRTLAEIGVSHNTKNHSWYRFIYQMVSFLPDIPDAELELICKGGFDRLSSEVTEIVNVGRAFEEATNKVEERFDPSILTLDVETLLQSYRLADNSWFFKEKLEKGKIKKELKKFLVSKDKIKTDKLKDILTTIQGIKEQKQFITQSDDLMNQYFPNLWNKENSNWNVIEEALQWMADVRKVINNLQPSQEWLNNTVQRIQVNKQDFSTNELKQQMDIFTEGYKAIMNHWEHVEKELILPNMYEAEKADWANYSRDKAALLIDALPELKDNCKLASVTNKADEVGLTNVTKPYLSGKLDHDEILTCYLYGFYRLRIDGEISQKEELSQFSKASFESKLHKFHAFDDELSELTKLEVYVKLMSHVPDLMNNTIQSSEPGILAKAIKSKGRGIAIRQLFERIKILLPKIKPCMLMSPLSVAQYLDPSFPKFDLVIFDEASQLPTSEAIGTMGRGKNVIVVGDPKQLPPTNFFGTKQEEENFDLQDLESVLDDSLSIQLPQKHLRWHYRSEHESLISFSNNHFYENKLITFPSIDDLHSRVSFINVEGTYDRGKTKQNKAEAQAIVNDIFSRLSNPEKQHESIGVVTFSQPQQTLIEDLIDERLKQDASLEKYFTDEVKEPVFVKNLENVQGDERDIILFTVGYGPDQLGQISLNFGPLNRVGGWRRLNVAVSRAKKEMLIFASMEPDKINLSRTKAEGVHSLRAFMEFAKKGKVPRDFENRAIIKQENSNVIIPKMKETLQQHGYQVETNVGNSDFKVDLAVINKSDSGKYLAAIQVDGHRYAGFTTTRDRNKLGELMLERLGWHILKVWSVEWWHNEEKQIKDILAQLKEVEKHGPVMKKQTESQPVKDKPSIHDKISNLTLPVDDKQQQACFYEPAVLEQVSIPNDYFYTYEGRPVIQEQIKKIIADEAPVSFSRLTKAIINAWGFSRSGAKLEKVIQDVLTGMTVYETIEDKGSFLWNNEEQFNSYRDFRIKNRYRRSLQDISKIEYSNGIIQIMKTALRLPKADIVREISKQLGYNRTSSNTEIYVQEAIDLNTNKSLIKEDTEGNIAYIGE
ncbi:DUF3320 domain-containing protein [Alkalihalobacillus sp. AL-G]|uniref:DUF3320 domain-containing protein n=1 Tax=Alkalihalobacillus sp. AL-G TaxID=2926399 RepID=UPI00272BF034|nr:DUF3320 domain-containing protein [Alkalihalobacillus sp. AL-G]WLD93800.1 DUF3320 domain-containing protein [Alkalihalobacillus sp. AL-G]